jgi:CxxC motif-containing protein
MKNSSIYLSIAVVTFIIGYLFLRFAFTSFEQYPFVQEVILIILGTIATIAITAALLNKQSEVELEKEQNVKIFDLKSNLYFELIDFLKNIVSKEEITKSDLISLEFLTHKISTIASVDVLKEYANFISTIKETSLDKKISPLESDELSADLSKLCVKIRYDLIAKDLQNNEIENIIQKNIEKI